MKTVSKQSRGGNKNQLTLVCNREVELMVKMPWVLAERLRCAAANAETTVAAYVVNALENAIECDEGTTEQNAKNEAVARYFTKAGLPPDHPFMAGLGDDFQLVQSLRVLSRLATGPDGKTVVVNHA